MKTKAPRLTKAMKTLGATTVTRTGDHMFNVGFELDGGELETPGCGAAIVDALSAKYGADSVQWEGAQMWAINLDMSA